MTQAKRSRNRMRTGIVLLACMGIVPASLAQRNGQPASDLLGQEDLAGNPTFVGGVTNGGPAGHSVW